MARIVLLLVFSSLLAGCYYAQAAKGQWELTRKREPIADVIADEATAEDLATRLRLVQQARQFAIDELALPDNDTYRTYADVERDYVVWNVFAAPEFSLKPRTWCFPVAGCVSYRGYFSKEAAEREAARLRAKGFDVAVGGVAAYSTLGKLKDPVLNTMMRWDDTELVAVLFHELAHQVLYVKDDSAFNESFATAVEEIGIQRWLDKTGDADALARYLEGRALREEIMLRVDAARTDLEALYGGALDAAAMRQGKRERLQSLQDEIAGLMRSRGRDPGSWLDVELNNARLVPMFLYQGRLPEFRELFDACEQRIECFYAAARELAGR